MDISGIHYIFQICIISQSMKWDPSGKDSWVGRGMKSRVLKTFYVFWNGNTVYTYVAIIQAVYFRLVHFNVCSLLLSKKWNKKKIKTTKGGKTLKWFPIALRVKSKILIVVCKWMICFLPTSPASSLYFPAPANLFFLPHFAHTICSTGRALLLLPWSLS